MAPPIRRPFATPIIRRSIDQVLRSRNSGNSQCTTKQAACSSTDQGGGKRRAGIRRSVHNGVTISVFYFGGDRENRHAYFWLLRLSDRLAFGTSADRHRRHSACCSTRHNAITASADSRRAGSTKPSGLTAPILHGLTLHRRRIRIFDLNPMGLRPIFGLATPD